MVAKLSLESGIRVLEPCAGDGIFIDALFGLNPDISIDAYELNPIAIELLREKYKSNASVSIIHDDTLTSRRLDLLFDGSAIYDRIIANPPYGGWLDYDKRRYLKKLGKYTLLSCSPNNRLHHCFFTPAYGTDKASFHSS
jgi:tRNA1(Val) A37 N6-methylase TrmN6